MLDVDGKMTFMGVGLAASVATFAVFAIRQNDGVPKIQGQEHLALFARPTTSRDERAAAISAGQRAVNPSASVDYSPTATIVGNPAPQAFVNRIDGDRVIVEGPSGLVELRQGEVAPGLGQLRDVRLVNGRFVAYFVPVANQSSR